MNRLMKFFAWLYPASWRNRYEAEFHALLEEVDPNWRTSLDILKGAVAMQLRTFSFAKIVAITGLIGLAIGLGAWLVIPDQYVSMSLLKIRPLHRAGGLPSEKAVSDSINAWARTAFSNRSLAEIIQKYQLYPAKQGKVPLEGLVTEMKHNIQIRPVGRDGVAFQFRYFDRPLAQRVTANLVNEFVDLSRTSTADAGSFNLGILDPASLPESPTSPNPKPLAIVGLLAGLIVGLSVAILRRLNPA